VNDHDFAWWFVGVLCGVALVIIVGWAT